MIALGILSFKSFECWINRETKDSLFSTLVKELIKEKNKSPMKKRVEYFSSTVSRNYFKGDKDTSNEASESLSPNPFSQQNKSSLRKQEPLKPLKVTFKNESLSEEPQKEPKRPSSITESTGFTFQEFGDTDEGVSSKDVKVKTCQSMGQVFSLRNSPEKKSTRKPSG